MNFNNGIKAIEGRRLSDAMEFFKQAIESKENIIESYIELGKCFLFVKQYKQSHYHFSVAKLKLAREYYKFKTMPKETYIAYTKIISIYNLALYNELAKNELLIEEFTQLNEPIANKIPTINFLKPIQD